MITPLWNPGQTERGEQTEADQEHARVRDRGEREQPLEVAFPEAKQSPDDRRQQAERHEDAGQSGPVAKRQAFRRTADCDAEPDRPTTCRVTLSVLLWTLAAHFLRGLRIVAAVAETSGSLAVLKLGKNRTSPAAANAAVPHDRAAEAYDRHSAALYSQALLTLGKTTLAERVVCEVIVDECQLAPTAAGDRQEAGGRLAQSVYARCRELTSVPDWRDEIPDGGEFWAQEGYAGPLGLLTAKERGVLALMLFGGLGYAQASRAAGTSPRETAILLRDALRRLTIPAR